MRPKHFHLCKVYGKIRLSRCCRSPLPRHSQPILCTSNLGATVETRFFKWWCDVVEKHVHLRLRTLWEHNHVYRHHQLHISTENGSGIFTTHLKCLESSIFFDTTNVCSSLKDTGECPKGSQTFRHSRVHNLLHAWRIGALIGDSHANLQPKDVGRMSEL